MQAARPDERLPGPMGEDMGGFERAQPMRKDWRRRDRASPATPKRGVLGRRRVSAK